jgi:hypothetical protein
MGYDELTFMKKGEFYDSKPMLRGEWLQMLF